MNYFLTKRLLQRVSWMKNSDSRNFSLRFTTRLEKYQSVHMKVSFSWSKVKIVFSVRGTQLPECVSIRTLQLTHQNTYELISVRRGSFVEKASTAMNMSVEIAESKHSTMKWMSEASRSWTSIVTNFVAIAISTLSCLSLIDNDKNGVVALLCLKTSQDSCRNKSFSFLLSNVAMNVVKWKLTHGGETTTLESNDALFGLGTTENLKKEKTKGVYADHSNRTSKGKRFSVKAVEREE